MDVTLLVGLAVVVVGAGAGAFIMFGQRANSLSDNTGDTGTIPAQTRRPAGDLTPRSAVTDPSSRPPVPRALRSTDVRIRWYQRIRSGIVLLIIVVGIGMAVGAVLGAVALAVGLLLS